MSGVGLVLSDPLVVGILAFLAVAFLSCAIPLKQQRASARSRAMRFRVQGTGGVLVFEASAAEVWEGREVYQLGVFGLVHYSRRFLLRGADRSYFLIVTNEPGRTFVRPLEADRARAVAARGEWHRLSGPLGGGALGRGGDGQTGCRPSAAPMGGGPAGR